MPFANSAGSRFGYVAEATYGVTPATPTFKPIRATGSGLRTNKSTGQSDEIRLDRNVVEEFQTGQDVAGTYDFELSYGSHDDFLAAALAGTWATNVLKNGVVASSFTVEETYRVGGVLNSFSRFTGVMVNSLSLNMAARGKITGQLGLMGQKEVLDSAIITGATYPAASTEKVMTSSSHIAVLTVAGQAIKARSLTLSIENNLRTRPVVGSLYTEELGMGRFSVTGNAEFYFESNALYQSVLDHGGGALAVTLGKDANKKYALSMPAVTFLNGEKRTGGVDDDVMVNIPFRAVYDPGIAATLQITRAVA